MPNHQALAHIPGPPVPMIVGHTLKIVQDSYGLHQDALATYGPVYKIKMLGVWRVVLSGADALETVLLDRDGIFSSHGGWDLISGIFKGGLMLQDFGEHRQNRRIMQAAFKAPALRDYLARMNTSVEDLVAAWPDDQEFRFYDAIKELTLRVGCSVFMGLPANDDLAEKLNQAFIDELRAALSVVRKPLPFTPMRRGLKSRVFLRETFRDMISQRRANPGPDFFSQMCIATDDDGKGWSEDEILDQFNFLMMAAHDTTATALTAMIWALGKHPEWQDTLAAEVADLRDGPWDDADLAKMVQTEYVFKEALRLVPPVPFIPRKLTKDFHWKGFDIPAGTSVTLNPGITMLSPELFSDPDTFDPGRFSPNRAEDQSHRFAWTPFGGGAHKCIGMHFSTLQVKLFVATLLRNRRINIDNLDEFEWQRLPIPQPKNGLPITLRSI